MTAGTIAGFISLSMLLVAMAQANEVAQHAVRCDGWEMEYLAFFPEGSGHSPLAALLLLHGAGDRAASFIQAWEPLARKKKIILIAPPCVAYLLVGVFCGFAYRGVTSTL